MTPSHSNHSKDIKQFKFDSLQGEKLRQTLRPTLKSSEASYYCETGGNADYKYSPLLTQNSVIVQGNKATRPHSIAANHKMPFMIGRPSFDKTGL